MPRWSRGLRPAIASLLTGLLLVTAVLSVSHPLHELLHSHGDAGQHHLCLVCSFAHGQVGLAEAASVALVFSIGLSLFLRLADTAALPAVKYRLLPSRAPPVSLFSF